MSERHRDKLEIYYCEYGVPVQAEEPIQRCGDIATSYVWWGEDKSNGIFVCEDHYQDICEEEDKNDE